MDDTYENGPIKFLVVSQTEAVPLRGSQSVDCKKQLIPDKDYYGRSRDKDYVYLKTRFINKYISDEKKDLCFMEIDKMEASVFLERLNKFCKELDGYKCFFFIFLTCMPPEDALVENLEETIQFKDYRKSLSSIWDSLKTVRQMVTCPKIFLVQNDDFSLLERETSPKGPSGDKRRKKVPQEADRLTILSTVPSCATLKEKPSLMIEAFLETMEQNHTQKLDMLSATVDINNRFDEKLKLNLKLRSTKIHIPMVTSTLSKFLYLHKFRQVEHDSKDNSDA